MEKKNLRIGFIGAGSIGSLFGGYLANVKSEIYSIEVIFFCLKAHADEVNTNGLKLYRNQQISIIKNIKAYEDEKIFDAKLEREPSFSFDFIFLTTKAYDSEAVVRQYKKLIDKSKWFVILQNGIGNEDIVIPYCDKSKIIRVVTSAGAFLDKPGHLIHTGEGITKIGFPFLYDIDLEEEIMQQAKIDIGVLRDILDLAGLETVIVDDIIGECWEKVLVNIGINALGALTRLPNGKLLEFEELRYIMGQAVKEAINVAEKKEIKLSNRDYIAITYDVAEKTAENKNSMLQDILNRKPTEIEFMNGRILKYAKDLGIKVPFNESLTFLIRGLEHSMI
ncbi:MAG: ketopantoate reductase family protein [Candidatus Hodarchaeota archaeon]